MTRSTRRPPRTPKRASRSLGTRPLTVFWLAKVPRQIRWPPSGEFGLTPPFPTSVRAGSNLNKFAGEIMTALAGVGSKLEAMQERLERNEAGVETMAEHLKSAVESLRMAEAAAAAATATTTTTTLATPAPVAPDPRRGTPPSSAPAAPSVARRRRPGAGGGPPRPRPVAHQWHASAPPASAPPATDPGASSPYAPPGTLQPGHPPGPHHASPPPPHQLHPGHPPASTAARRRRPVPTATTPTISHPRRRLPPTRPRRHRLPVDTGDIPPAPRGGTRRRRRGTRTRLDPRSSSIRASR